MNPARRLRVSIPARRIAIATLAVATAGLIASGTAHGQAGGAIQAGTITAGGMHSCAILTSGQAVCWGSNGWGQLGDGTETARSRPVAVSGLTDVKEISAGNLHTCAIRNSGQTLCWGRNDSRQLGDGTTTKRLTPTPVSGLADAKKISAADSHSCAIRNSGQAVCWGLSSSGSVGDGTATAIHPIPVSVTGLGDAKEISAGGHHSCAIRNSGQAVCWGSHSHGQVGKGGMANGSSNNAPVDVSGLSDAAKIGTGQLHSCAVRTSGAVVCWGDNYFGTLGDNKAVSWATTPTAVIGLTDAKDIDLGYVHACAIRNSGQTVCWGNNIYGQLGDGSTENRHTPVAVNGLADAKAISGGTHHTCAVRTSGQAVCWGRNDFGRLGDGSTENRHVPTIVSAVSAGGNPPGGGSGPGGDPPPPAKPKLGAVKVKSPAKAVKPGGKVALTVRVKNTGKAAKAIKVCVKAPKKKIAVKKCKSSKRIAPGKIATIKFQATVKRKAKAGKAALTFTATAPGLKKTSGKATVKIR